MNNQMLEIIVTIAISTFAIVLIGILIANWRKKQYVQTWGVHRMKMSGGGHTYATGLSWYQAKRAAWRLRSQDENTFDAWVYRE